MSSVLLPVLALLKTDFPGIPNLNRCDPKKYPVPIVLFLFCFFDSPTRRYYFINKSIADNRNGHSWSSPSVRVTSNITD